MWWRTSISMPLLPAKIVKVTSSCMLGLFSSVDVKGSSNCLLNFFMTAKGQVTSSLQASMWMWNGTFVASNSLMLQYMSINFHDQSPKCFECGLQYDMQLRGHFHFHHQSPLLFYATFQGKSRATVHRLQHDTLLLILRCDWGLSFYVTAICSCERALI
jgi:hypothetical protein